MGRPKKYTDRVTVRLGPRELAYVDRVARSAGMNRAEVIRHSLNNSTIAPSREPLLRSLERLYGQQRQLGGLCKLALREGHHRRESRQALVKLEESAAAILAYMRKVSADE
ncbi:MAG: hypothetical protein AAGF12_39380 [Myxococcota bacterium]